MAPVQVAAAQRARVAAKVTVEVRRSRSRKQA
jgi:hypothetical protein